MNRTIDVSKDAADETLNRDFRHMAIVFRCYESEAKRDAAWRYFQFAVEAESALTVAVTNPETIRVLRVA